MNTMNTKVGILGAGLSGVLMGMQLRRAGIDDFVIYEKESDVGGTWLCNTYPGLHCDVPSHLYSYSFEPNPDWSTVHASQPEIQAYIRACAEKYDLIGKIRFGVCVDEAYYDDAMGTWRLTTADGETIEHRALVSATGGLTEPNLPQIEGLDEFEGPTWHSGAWRDDVDMSDKRVAVIGSAASAVQVVPEVANRAKELHVFQRSPNWVMPRNNVPYTEEQKAAFRKSAAQRAHWRELYRRSLYMYRVTHKDPRMIKFFRETVLHQMRKVIDDPALIEALTPDYDPGCKRIVVSDDYYPALAKEHVHLHPHAVTALTATGVVAAGGAQTDVDIVIFCTGYKLGARADGGPAVEVYGRNGQRLLATLAKRAEAFRGIAVPGFPNYFTVCGINGVAAYTSLILSGEIQTEHIAQRIKDLVEGRIKSIEAKADVTREYNDLIQAELQTMSWTGPCTNFYRDRTGRVVSFYPGTLGRMRREMRHIDNDDYAMEMF
ncbi:MAG: NAD(P)/FAD-dependent oxidoreductase [Rhodospirillaceae bacterium]